MKDFLYWLSLTMLFTDAFFILLVCSKRFLRNRNFRLTLSVLTSLTVVLLNTEYAFGFIKFPDIYISFYLLIASGVSFISCVLNVDFI